MSAPTEIPEVYGRALSSVGALSLSGVQALEQAFRRLHPPQIPALRSQLAPVRDRLEDALEGFREHETPEGLDAFHAELGGAADAVLAALAGFLDRDPRAHPAAGVLTSMRAHAHAQELLYPLRFALPPLARYFAEEPFHGATLDPEEPDSAGVGLHRAGDAEDGRGGFELYVPEHYTGERSWPLVVALHGGSGTGRGFLWTWLREARGRGFLLLAPTSRGSTWALDHAASEAPALVQMIELVRSRWNVDPERILLTGLSDGATFTLLAGLSEGAPYTALAPVSGVLHPASFRLGNLDRAAGRRIRLVHGALDWMFPVAIAREARDVLERAGADLVYREIEDLSHTYPREENDAILAWFDPSLALPATAERPDEVGS